MQWLNDLFDILSLRYFSISLRRKLWFVVMSLVLVTIVVMNRGDSLSAHLPTEVIRLGMVILGSYLFVSLMRFFVVTAYRKRHGHGKGDRSNFVLAVDATGSIIVTLITIASIFPVFDVPVTQFITSISLFSVALGILFKDYLQNFFDAVRIMYTNDFRIGDTIKLNETDKGTIIDITFQTTRVKTERGDVLFIPNNSLTSKAITNQSHFSEKTLTIPFTIPPKHAPNLTELESELVAVVGTVPDTTPTDIKVRFITLEKDKLSGQVEFRLRENPDHEAALRRAVFQYIIDKTPAEEPKKDTPE
jgi:small-conductance mechanosensitive channel